MRRKAQAYLENGTALVWLVQPKRRGVEVCRLSEGQSLQTKFVGRGDKLSGEDILPGFELKVDLLFPPPNN
jgi:Uma2 family endonuclease